MLECPAAVLGIPTFTAHSPAVQPLCISTAGSVATPGTTQSAAGSGDCLGHKAALPTCPAPLSLAHRFSGFRDVAQLLQAGVWHCDHAHIGLNGAKGEVGCSCLAVLNNCIEQC